MPKVSVIVPVYNVENYIRKCLESLVEQTLEEIEIIIVNDGTKDNSMSIIKEFADKYPQKIVILEKENGGLSDARNYAIPHAKGEYIAFLDSDDYIEKNMYQDMYEIAKKEKSDMVECDFYWEYPHKTKTDIGQIYQGKKQMLEKIRVVAWNKLIKRKILQETKIRFPVGYHYEDVEFTYQLIPYLEKVSFLKKPCIHYIQREGSISNSQNERTKEIFDILENVINFYKQKGIYEEYQEQLEYIYVRILFCSSFLRMVKIQDRKIRNELLKQTWENVKQKFPNWKKNEILRKNKSVKNLYMRTLNKVTYKIYSQIFRRI
ncbi:MAG: glycosyltransferase [Clostridia bacterium]|nr:glycosyltransferase [Clostridia bacterium]